MYDHFQDVYVQVPRTWEYVFTLYGKRDFSDGVKLRILILRGASCIFQMSPITWALGVREPFPAVVRERCSIAGSKDGRVTSHGKWVAS